MYIYTINKLPKPIMPPVECTSAAPKSAEALLARCEDKDGGVRRSAVKALEKARKFSAKKSLGDLESSVPMITILLV